MRVPKRRARVSKKRSSKNFRHFPGIILSLLLLSLLTFLLGWSSLLSVKTVAISGTLEKARIAQAISESKPAIKVGTPLARVDVSSLARLIAKNSWVSSVEIGRSWIHGALTIHVQERLPVASYQDTDGYSRYFDAQGVDFQSPIHYSDIPAIELGSSTTTAKSAIATFITNLHQSDPALLQSAQGFAVSAPDAISMKAKISPAHIVTIHWGSSSDLSLKLTVYKKLIALKESKKATIFDLSDPLSPITK